MTDPQLYLPNDPAVTSRAATGPALTGDESSERRVVTILFCDVAGSTAMAEVLDPEEWAEVMNEAFELMIRPIERYGGTVTRLMGDAVLALFGAPHAHGDDPQRAILAALEIMEGIQPLRERIQSRYGLDFNVRAGINTGLVVVGAFGADDMVEYTAMGDAINVAARLEALAAPGTICIGEPTYRLTAPHFEVEPMGASDVRGKREPGRTYRVLGRARTAHASEFSRREMPFTGREAEMAMIREAIDELRFTGKGRIIAISGEAGVGKSRIVDEVIEYVRSLPPDDGGLSIALLEKRLNPYDDTRPYAGLQDRFRKVFGIEINDSSEVVRHKFIQHTSQFAEEFRERAAQMIQRVLALDFDPHAALDDAPFAPEEFKAELSAVVVQIVRGWNPDGAFMLVGEDYQWGDEASLEIVSQLYGLLGDRPVLFLCTFRPVPDAPVARIFEQVRAQYGKHLLEIELQPLQEQSTRALVEQLIEGDASPAARLREVILRRADGNPLFIEELVQSLAEQGALERIAGPAARWRVTGGGEDTHATLPNSLQALLLERIDRLPPGARRTLQQAAVLGRTFNRRVLREVVQVDGDPEQHLATLMELDMIRATHDSGDDDNLAFRHAMTQEVAYSTILLRHRRHFHRRAAETIERLFPDRLSEYASDVGQHYYQAGDTRGAGWLLRAAEHAQAVYEPELVIEFTGKALELSAQDKPPVLALLLRGRARDMVGDFEGARGDLEQVIEIARGQQQLELKWEALIDLGALWAESDYSTAGAYIRDALALAHILGDEARVARSLNRMGNWYINVGDPASARRAHEEARAIFERLDDVAGSAETLDLIGLASYLSTDFEGSAASFRQAITMFRELGNNRGLSSSLAMLALTGGFFDAETANPARGEPEEWLGYAREAVEVARSISWSAGEAFALLVLGELEFAFGQVAEALKDIERSLKIARAIDHRQWTLANIQALGGLALDLFNYERAYDYLTDGLQRARELGSAYWSGHAVARLIDWQLAHNQASQAEQLLAPHIDLTAPLDCTGQRKLWFRRAKLALARNDPRAALDIVERLEYTAPSYVSETVIARLSALRGQALLGMGLREAGIEALTAAVAAAAGAHDWLRELGLRMELARAYDTLGEPGAAAEQRQRARALADDVAAQLPEGEWRDAFTSGVSARLG